MWVCFVLFCFSMEKNSPDLQIQSALHQDVLCLCCGFSSPWGNHSTPIWGIQLIKSGGQQLSLKELSSALQMCAVFWVCLSAPWMCHLGRFIYLLWSQSFSWFEKYISGQENVWRLNELMQWINLQQRLAQRQEWKWQHTVVTSEPLSKGEPALLCPQDTRDCMGTFSVLPIIT